MLWHSTWVISTGLLVVGECIKYDVKAKTIYNLPSLFKVLQIIEITEYVMHIQGGA